MFETLIIWIIAFIFSSLSGILIQSFGINKENDAYLFTLISGFCFLVVYSQTYSLLFPIKSCVCLGLLLVLLIVLLIINKKKVSECFVKLINKNKFKTNQIVVLFIVSVVLLFYFVLVSSQTSYDIDDLTYHCQAVRWIEEFGVVRGSGLINSRVSFNSSLFAVYALFGFRDILGETAHTINGFVAFITLIGLLIELFKNKNKYSLCTFGIAVYYIICIKLSLNTLNTDIIPNLIICCIIELWLNYNNKFIRADLCIVIFIAITMKLSFAMLGIISTLPIIEFIKKKEYKQIAFYSFLGLFVTLPFLLRNYLISGWLLYPLTAIDIFDVEWKVPAIWAQEQADWIYAWARRGGAEGIEAAHFAFKDWFPMWWIWFAYRNMKIVLVASVLLIITWIVYFILKRVRIESHLITIIMAFLFEDVYWLITAPAIRFAFIPVYVLPVLLLISLPIIDKLTAKYLLKNSIQTISICMIMCYFVLRFTISDCEMLLVKPSYFSKLKANKYRITENITLYYPLKENGWSVGVDFFPGGEYIDKIEQIEPIGKTIKEGFRIKK